MSRAATASMGSGGNINPLGIKTIYNILKEAEANLIAKHNSIKSVPYNGIAEGISERIYINSNGALRQTRGTHASLYLYARAEETGRKPRSSGAVRLAHGAKDIDIESCIEEASEKTIAHLNYQPIETGRYLICFSPDAIFPGLALGVLGLTSSDCGNSSGVVLVFLIVKLYHQYLYAH